MIQLGVSLYPEQETLKDVEAYLAMASAYGFTKVFTSMFSVKGTREEVVGYFKEFTKIAHKYNMKVSGDCNSEFFERMGATERDLSAFKDMGIDIIRMDFSLLRLLRAPSPMGPMWRICPPAIIFIPRNIRRRLWRLSAASMDIGVKRA